MKKNTVWIFSKRVVVVPVKVIAIQMLATKTATPLQRPKWTLLLFRYFSLHEFFVEVDGDNGGSGIEDGGDMGHQGGTHAG